jgi:hypothetical protein
VEHVNAVLTARLIGGAIGTEVCDKGVAVDGAGDDVDAAVGARQQGIGEEQANRGMQDRAAAIAEGDVGPAVGRESPDVKAAPEVLSVEVGSGDEDVTVILDGDGAAVGVAPAEQGAAVVAEGFVEAAVVVEAVEGGEVDRFDRHGEQEDSAVVLDLDVVNGANAAVEADDNRTVAVAEGRVEVSVGGKAKDGRRFVAELAGDDDAAATAVADEGRVEEIRGHVAGEEEARLEGLDPGGGKAGDRFQEMHDARPRPFSAWRTR